MFTCVCVVYTAVHHIFPIKRAELDFGILLGGILKGDEPTWDETMLIIYSLWYVSQERGYRSIQVWK